MNSRFTLSKEGIWLWIFFLLALRFAFWGDTVFILDEPLFQLRLDEHMANGTFPLTSFRGSSIPLPYGAGAMWFYYLARLIVWHPYALVLYHITAVTAGALLFLSTARKKFGEERTRWIGLLMASSPLLFYFSRHPWDNTLLFTVGAIIVWCLVQLEEQKREYLYHAIMGVAVGYALNIHLMFGPVALALGITLKFRAWKLYGIKSKKFWLPLLLFSATALLMLLPYLWEAFHIMQVEQPLEHTKYTKRWGDGRNIWWLIQRSVIFSSIWGSRIYLDTVHPQFEAFVGRPLAFLFHNDLFGWIAKLTALTAVVAYPFRYFSGTEKFDTLKLFVVTSFFSMVLVLHFLNIPTAPHYFHSVWWLVFLGLAFAFPRLRGRWKQITVGSIVLTAVVNTLFIFTSLAFFHINKGTRSFNFSVSVSEQLRAVKEICTEASARIPKEARVDLGDAFILGPGFVYLPKHMPECKDVKFTAEKNLDHPNFRLSHPADSATKADLVINWIAP